MSNEDAGSGAKPPRMSIASLFSGAPSAPPAQGLGVALAQQEGLFRALGAKPGLFSMAEPGAMPARDLLARQLAELAGEDPEEVIAALGDETNAAARTLDKLLSGMARPKGLHRGKVGRPSAAMDHFAAWILGSALKEQGHSQAEMQRRLAVALRRLGINLRPAGALSAFHKGRKRFGSS